MKRKISRKRPRSFEKTKAIYGRLFVLPWVIGFVVFFLIPISQSINYSFSEVVMKDKLTSTFNGIANYKYVWGESLNFRLEMKDSIVGFFYSLPIITILSLILAVILNQKFKGRLIARAVFFLPVIIASGVVIKIMNQDVLSSQLREGSMSGGITYGGVNFAFILQNMGISEQIVEPIIGYLQQIFNLIWGCGVQTILFLAGLQSIPEQLYEVSTVEGATAWESFWFITVPMISNITILVIVYTIIDLFTSPSNKIMERVYTLIGNQNYDNSAALMWSFFAIVGAIVGVVIVFYNWVFRKKKGD